MHLQLPASLLAASIISLGAAAQPVSLQEPFSSDPLQAGWTVAGDPALFRWDSAAGTLRATWDSARPNSYFARPLPTVVARDDDFAFGFDLNLEDIRIGTTPDKPYTFQLAVGLLHWRTATNAGFLRGSGFNSPNLVEFNYFPDSGFGATVSPTLISTNHDFAVSFNFPIELVTNAWHRVVLSYTASNHTLAATLVRDGQLLGPLQNAVLSTNFTDFRLDCLAVASYSDTGQDPQYAGSILAHGSIDNLWFTGPAPLQDLRIQPVTEGWEVRFLSRSGFVYSLERSASIGTWTPVGTPTIGTGGQLRLVDDAPETAHAFYRVQAHRP